MSMNFLIMPFSDFHIFELYEVSDIVINKCSTRHLLINKALITNRCLLVKTLKMFRIPCMLQDFSLLCLEFVIAWPDDSGYDVRSFPVGAQFSMRGIFSCRQELL